MEYAPLWAHVLTLPAGALSLPPRQIGPTEVLLWAALMVCTWTSLGPPWAGQGVLAGSLAFATASSRQPRFAPSAQRTRRSRGTAAPDRVLAAHA